MIIQKNKNEATNKINLLVIPQSQEDWRILRNFMDRYLNEELNDYDTAYRIVVDEELALILDDMCFDF